MSNKIAHAVTDGLSYSFVYEDQIKQKCPNIKQVAELYFGENDFGRTNKEVSAYFFNKIAEPNKQWLESNRTDFSVYTHPNYIYDVIFCFYNSSKACIDNYIKWAKTQNIDPATQTVFELYPGAGLTLLSMALNGYTNLEYYNDNPDQIALTNKLFDQFNLPHPVNNPDWRTKQYDIVMGFEVIEHFKEPLVTLRELLACCKKYYVEATGFKVNHYTGHFDLYNVEGQVITNAKVPKHLRGELKNQNFSKVFAGFNAKPRIWQKG